MVALVRLRRGPNLVGSGRITAGATRNADKVYRLLFRFSSSNQRRKRLLK